MIGAPGWQAAARDYDSKNSSSSNSSANKSNNSNNKSSSNSTNRNNVSSGNSSASSGSFNSSNKSSGGYKITSQTGINAVNGMKQGQSFSASDGSTWRKNGDGTVDVTTKNGTIFTGVRPSSGSTSLGNSVSSGGYAIDSQKGQDIAASMRPGQSFSASDGSTWVKQSDGSINVTTKGGGNYNVSVSGGSTRDYQGTTIDLTRDYQKEINNAVAAGDYNTANKLQNERNAKINYLNQSIDGWSTNNNVSATNNKYTFDSFSDLPSNWTNVNVGGNNYTYNNNGIYDSTNKFLGNGYNSATNEFTFNNRNDAINAANKYLESLVNAEASKYGLTAEDYLNSGGAVDSSFVDAVASGNVDNYSQQLAADKAEWERQQELLRQQQEEQRRIQEERERQLALIAQQQEEEYRRAQEQMAAVNQGQQLVSQVQQPWYSPTTDALTGTTTAAQNDYTNSMNNYLEYIQRQLGINRVNIR